MKGSETTNTGPDRGERSRAGPETEPGCGSDLTRILLVEDNPGDARLMEEVFSRGDARAEFELICAPTLSKGIEIVENEGVDIVLLDLSLPDSYGLDTFARMHRVAPHLPIIIRTGNEDEEGAVRSVTAGAQDYLMKGEMDPRLILRSIRYAIERKKVQQKLARYTRELQNRNREMAEELELAREIQQSLIPGSYPTLPRQRVKGQGVLRFCHRYIPTAELAGDFFETIDISDSEAGVFICDVMGHGVCSAMVAAMLHALVEEKSRLGADPSHFLGEVNRGLISVLKERESPIFATAFYLTVNLDKREIRYASAGHPRPMRLRRAEGTVGRLPIRDGGRGPALGLFPEAEFPTQVESLDLHDLIILFTDGLWEAENEDGEPFLDKRLRESIRAKSDLPPGALFDGVLKDVRAFSRSEKFDDDVCLVGLEFKTN